jgi:hypothetical protein
LNILKIEDKFNPLLDDSGNEKEPKKWTQSSVFCRSTFSLDNFYLVFGPLMNQISVSLFDFIYSLWNSLVNAELLTIFNMLLSVKVSFKISTLFSLEKMLNVFKLFMTLTVFQSFVETSFQVSLFNIQHNNENVWSK